MLHLAVKAFSPARVPFPVMHVDTGHNFAEVLAFRDAMVERVGARLVVASVQDDIDAGALVEDTGPRASRNRLQTVTLLRGIEEQRVRRRVRRRPPRRGEGPGQGAGVQLPRRVRPVGPEEPAARAVEPLQRPPPQGRAHPGVPAVELDRARHLAVHRRRGHRAPVDLLRPPAPGVPARRHVAGRLRRSSRACPARRSRSARCASAPSATSPAPARSSRRPPPSTQVIAEVAATRLTERGATRADDRISEAGMEDRKKEGYF